MAFVAPMLGQVALSLAFTVGASLVSNLIRPKSAKPAASQTVTTSRGISFELTVGESVPVSAIFGRGRAQGHLVFAQEYGANNEYLKVVIKCGRGWYDGFEQLMVDEKVRALSGSNADIDGLVVDDFTLDADGNPDAGGTPRMWVKAYTGAPGQAADPGLIAATSRWTAAHKLTGCPYLVVTIRQAAIFGSYLPRIGSVWRGLRLYDWRHDSTVAGSSGTQRWADPATWAWTENLYVIRWNYRRGYWINGVKLLGMGFSERAQDLEYYTAAANIADEPVFYPETSATLARYAFGREIFADEDHQAVLVEMDGAGCGTSFDRGGADAPLPAAQRVAAFTLEDRHLLRDKPAKVDRWGKVSDKFTASFGSFVAQSEDWATRPYGIRSNAGLEATIGGRKLREFTQPYEYRRERAQARAEIELRKNLFGARRTETFGPRTNVLELGDPFTRVMGDWGSMLAVVEGIEPLPGRIGNIITWREWDNSIVPASGDSFITLPPDVGPGPQPADRTIAVSGLTVAPYSRAAGGAVLPYGRATWTHIADPNVSQVKIVVWPEAGTEPDDSEEFFADARLSDAKLFGPLAPETDFTGYAIPIRRDNRLCVRTNQFFFTTGPLTTPAEVADDSVGIAKLVQEVRNQLSVAMSDLPARILQAEAQLAAEASANITDQVTNRTCTTLLKTEVGKAIAAVIQEAAARVEDNAAFAMALTQVSAEIENFGAGGLLRFDATVTGGGAEATINLMVRARAEDDFVDSGIRIGATADLVGGTTSEILLLANKLLITDGTNTSSAFRFDAVTGDLVLKRLRFEDLSSIAENSGAPVVEIDGDTGAFSLGGG